MLMLLPAVKHFRITAVRVFVPLTIYLVNLLMSEAKSSAHKPLFCGYCSAGIICRMDVLRSFCALMGILLGGEVREREGEIGEGKGGREERGM